MPATPIHTANRKPMKARIARVPIDGRSARIWTSLTAAARNVVSTARTDGPAEKSDAMWVCGSQGRLMASCARLENSLSARATKTTSGAISRTSCGSVCFGFSVECIGAPYSVQCHPHMGGRRIYAKSTTFCPTLHSGLTKARRYDGQYRAAKGDSLRELGSPSIRTKIRHQAKCPVTTHHPTSAVDL